MRKIQFQTEEYYHIYNRGVDKREIFTDDNDFIRFLRSMREFNVLEPIGSLKLQKIKSRAGHGGNRGNRGLTPLKGVKPLEKKEKLVNIVCYCLNPNHFHLILEQRADKGISEFMKRLGGGYTCYFNQKYSRSGSLFQGTFKSIPIASTDYLLQLSCYINGNPEIHKIAKAENYQWSSYQDYLGKRNGTLCKKEEALNQVQNTAEYKDLVDITIKDSGDRKDEIKKFILE